MKIIVGLGNPGQPYVFTRHNIGFRLIETIAQDRKISLKKHLPCRAVYGQGKFKDRPFILAQPLTFMNESGVAVKLLVEKFSIPLTNLLIIYDDIDLPLGTIRFRAKGGAGTHRGMQSCVEVLGSADFPRLRLGIRGERGGRDLSAYVLENFTEEEEAVIRSMIAETKERFFTFLLT